MTAAFDAQLAADTRQPVWLAVLTTTRRCANTYASAVAPSTCTAADAGDGARCYYSYATCQDRANFRAESHSWYFTSADMPLPPDIAAAYPSARPLLKSVSPVAQQVSFSSSSTAPGHLGITLSDTGGDDDAGPFDLDKSVRNSTRAGSGLKRWLAQWPNLGHMTLTLKLGFLADGFTTVDWAARSSGTLSSCEVNNRGEWSLRAEDVLTRAKKELPRKYSSTVELESLVAPADTTWTLTDVSEIRVGDKLIVRGVGPEDEIVQVTAIDSGLSTIDVTREVNGTASYMLAGTQIENVLDWDAARPLDIVQDLLSGVGVTEIEAASFTTADLWIGPVGLTRRIRAKDAKSAISLCNEILELFQAALVVTSSGTVGVALNRPLGASETAEVITDERILANTSHGLSGEPQRLTHVAVVWDKVSEDVYTVTAAVNGETFVADYFGSEPEDRREKKIESAWIRPGSSTAWGAAVRWSHVFALPPRGLDWDGPLSDDAITVGTIIETDTSEVQDAHGANLAKRMIVTSKRPGPVLERLSFQAQATGFDETTDTGERWGAIAPNATPVYGSASAAEKAAYIFLGDASNLVGTGTLPGYVLA